MNRFALVVLVLAALCGCGVTVEPAPACAWVDDPQTLTQSCGGDFAQQKHFETVDDGESACWFYEETCSTTGAQPAANECTRHFVSCQPVGAARVGGP